MTTSIDKHIIDLTNQGQFDEAKNLIYKNIAKYQNNESIVLLYILYQIRDEELQNGITDIFTTLYTPKLQSSENGNVISTECNDNMSDMLLRHYRLIKFCLRRYEYNMPEDSLADALNYLISRQVSIFAIYRIAQFACVDTDTMFKHLASAYRSVGDQIMADNLEMA